MGIRVQPADIEIPERHPFKNDLLGRKESVDVLSNVLASIEGPCVLGVDGAWGAGKTTFLKLLSQTLRNRSFPVIAFNAWETDFADDPFLALSQELNNGLRKYTSGPLDGKLDDVKQAIVEVCRRAVPGTIRLATAGLLDVGPLLEKEAGHVLASYAQARMDNYVESKRSLQAFRASLERLASDLAATNAGRPVVVIIDELDRCRPSYAVELLETAKHFFTVDHVVFALAVNRTQLAHAVRAVYGGEFDAFGYLRRFFDIDFQLPEAKRGPFVEAVINGTGIDDYFRRKPEEDGYETVRDWLVAFFEAFHHVSFRTISQAIHHLGLVFASLRPGQRSLTVATTLAVVMRTIDLDLYRGFVRGELEDRNVTRALLGDNHPAIQHIRHDVEAIIIVAADEVRRVGGQNKVAAGSPLLEKHRATAANEGDDDEKALYSQDVIDSVERFAPRQLEGRYRLEFKEAVRRLELVSNSLVEDVRDGAP